MLIAQISDMHVKADGELLYGRVDTAAYLARAVAHINALDPRPDIVIATGDLVEGGKPEEYAHLRHLLEPLAMPVYPIPGNHDAREPMREAFADHGYLPRHGFLHYVIETLPLRLIALDSLVPGRTHGALCAERLGWLKARLGESDRPTIIVVHHPPFDCGIAPFDAEGMNEGAEGMGDLVRRQPNIERVMCGHVHRPIQLRWAGTLASIAPSTAHQAALDLRQRSSFSMIMEPPGLALHLWRPGTGLITHVSYVGTYTSVRSLQPMA
jgi:3',5'-cyclic AMP phosphodiesterase CpdA